LIAHAVMNSLDFIPQCWSASTDMPGQSST